MAHKNYQIPYTEKDLDFLNDLEILWYGTYNLEVYASGDPSQVHLGEHLATETSLALFEGSLRRRTLIVTGTRSNVEKFEGKLMAKLSDLEIL